MRVQFALLTMVVELVVAVVVEPVELVVDFAASVVDGKEDIAGAYLRLATVLGL